MEELVTSYTFPPRTAIYVKDLRQSVPILLDGPLERAQFPPLLSAFIGLIVAFLLFQGVSTVFLLLATMQGGIALTDLLTPEGLSDFLADNADTVIWANTIGQLLGLLIPALLITRLHSSSVRSFIRFRPASGRDLIWSAVGLLGMIPLVHFSAGFSDSLPWPEWVRSLEDGQMELIEQILIQDFSLVFAVSMLALTPAICEEVLFRGYIQRQAERSIGAWGGILFSGIIFGLYHLRLTQAIPLSMLGIFMAWLTWQTRSLWPAILVHLMNNTFAAVLGKSFSESESGLDMEEFTFPWWVILTAALVLGAAITMLRKSRLPQEDSETATSHTADHTRASEVFMEDGTEKNGLNEQGGAA
jgi:membrane protease YdiL (CAAX protease family)